MKKPYFRLPILPLTGHDFQLINSFTYKDITIPKGFISNGANIPRTFWFIVPPNFMDIAAPIAMHDYLCSIHKYKLADIYFIEMLSFCTINKFQFKTLSYGVRSYTYAVRPILIKYNLHKQD